MRIVAALLAAACAGEPDVGPFPPCDELRLESHGGGHNLVIVVNDTWRRDRTGVYGGPAKTPAFDAFARDHLLFTNAVTESPWTRPAIGTLFTSLYPSQHRHGIAGEELRNFDVGRFDVLIEAHTTLAEVMRDAGFDTAGFIGNLWLHRQLGLAQGFEVVETWDYKRRQPPGEEITREALAWLGELPADRPFFLYVHYMDSHRPYGLLSEEEVRAARERIEADDRPLPTAAKLTLLDELELESGGSVADAGVRPTLRLLEMAYDRGVEDFDRAFGSLLEGLRAHPAWERTAMIVTSDHGEALFARGWGKHGRGLFDDETAIPFAAHLPAVEPRSGEVDCAVGLVDVLPTLCTYFGLTCPELVQGRSFVLERDEPPPSEGRFLVTEGVMGHSAHRAVQNGSYKIMWEPDGRLSVGPLNKREPTDQPWSLYDLADDPGESENLLARRVVSREAHEAYKALWPALRDAVRPAIGPPPTFVKFPRETVEQLRALGYLQDRETVGPDPFSEDPLENPPIPRPPPPAREE